MSRIPNVVTKTGDYGRTSLYSGEKVKKNSAVIRAVGKVDSLHRAMGLCHSKFQNTLQHVEIQDSFYKIQQRLFILMGEIAYNPAKVSEYLKKQNGISKVDLDYLEKGCEQIRATLEGEDYKIEGWMLYGEEGELSALIDFCGGICREAEIESWNVEGLRVDISQYLNRLGDYFYYCARLCRTKN